MSKIDIIRKTVLTEPCFDGGASFKTHNLGKTSNGYSFKPSIGGILFASLFALIGLAFFIGGVYKVITTKVFLEYLFFIIFGSVFLAAGILLLLLLLRPRVFNKNSNYYYKGFKKNPNRTSKKYTPLNKIVALQIIGETIDSKNGDYKSFELNLVLDDASRLNVVDHGNLKILIEDAKVLSHFLSIPIWHAESKNT